MYEAQSEFKEGRGGRGGLTEQSLMWGKVQQLYRYFQELQVYNSYTILQMPKCGPQGRGSCGIDRCTIVNLLGTDAKQQHARFCEHNECQVKP